MKYVILSKRTWTFFVVLIIFSIITSSCGMFNKKCPDCPSFANIAIDVNNSRFLND